jgi:hypothetical protein
MEQLINLYFENGAIKLHRMVDKILYKLNFHDVDNRDFYSLAHEIFFTEVVPNYDKSQSFDGFLYSCLYKKFCTNMTSKTRDKRSNNIKVEKRNVHGDIVKDEHGNVIMEKVKIPDRSIEEPINDDGDSQLKDIIGSKFNLESFLIGSSYDSNMERYLSNLNETQKKIAGMIGNGSNSSEIKEVLGLNDKEYSDQILDMKSYEKRRVYYENTNKCNDMEGMKMGETAILTDNTTETFKNTSYSIDSISKQLQKKMIRDDHILQRHSGQWKSFARSELVSDILRGKSLTQIIISEEKKKGVKMQWIIDGKQRCTTLDDYLHNGFAISKNVKNYNIRYQTTKLDENGNPVLNEEGFTVMEIKTFDIRGKKFSQLPEELQDIFKDRQIPVLYNMDCTKKDIADDIARFNRSRPMNTAQNGWLGLDEDFAELAEKISTMPFFQTDFVGSKYTKNNRTSGSMRRIVVESIMVSDFIDEYCKEFEKMCKFLSDEASDSNFTEFYSYVDRLTAICDKDVASLFNAKDSFLWFGLFARFAKTGLDDSIFVLFLKEYLNSLHEKEINGVSFDDLNKRSTKDKSVVMAKMQHLETLMSEFIHINKDDLKDVDTYDFVKEVSGTDITKEDMDQYEEVLDDLTVNVDNASMLLNKHNRPALVALVIYSFQHDIDLDHWIVDYFKRNNTYILNTKKSYLQMRQDLTDWIGKQVAA